MAPRSLFWCVPVGIAGFLAAGVSGEDTLDYDVLEYINPLIGSAGGGTVLLLYLMVYPTNLSTSRQAMSSPARQCLMAWPKPLPTPTPRLTREDLHTTAVTSPASLAYTIQAPEDLHRWGTSLYSHT